MRNFMMIVVCIAIVSHCSNEQSANLQTTEFRLIAYNVWYGFTKVPERKSDWLQWVQVQQPDIVSLQELNEYTPEQLQADAQRWGHDYSVLLKEDGFPTGVTSRYPIHDVQRTLEGFHHGLLRVKIGEVYVYVIHLHPGNWEIRAQEMTHILRDIESLPEDASILLAGDFNTFSVHDSIYYAHGELEPFFHNLDVQYDDKNLHDGQLDYSVLQRLEQAGFIDLEVLMRGKTYQFTGSFPTHIEKPGEHGSLRRLDYVFATPDLAERAVRAEIVADSITQVLSDHLPVIVDFE